MKAEVFTEIPNQLKTIEIDVEKKIFKVNGIPFGDNCTGFSIVCGSLDGYALSMQIDTTVKYADYDMGGKKETDQQYEIDGQSVAF